MFYGMNAWFLATLAVGALWWVAGAAHPAWSKLEPRAGAQAYVSSWSRGGPVLAIAALAAAALGVAAAFDDQDPYWAVGSGFLISAVVFTVLVMGKPGHALRDHAQAPAEHDVSEQIRTTLRLWGRLHLLRSGLATIGVFFFIVAAH